MKVCCVQGCTGPPTPNPVFFEFPSSRLLRKRWLDAINSSSEASAESVVCISHFGRGDYELVGGQARLKSRVVPSRRIGGESEDEDSDSSSSESDESSTSERTHEKSENNTKNNKDNGKFHNDKDKTQNENNEKAHNDNEERTVQNNEKNKKKCDAKQHGPVDNENICTENVKANSDNILDNLNNEKVDKNGKDNESVDKNNIDKNNEKVDNNEKDSESVDKRNVEKNNEKVDNGTENDDKNKEKKVQGRKTRCKITAMRAVNGRRGRRRRQMSPDSSSSPDSVSSSPERSLQKTEPSKEDIEESLQHYYIENKKTERQVAAMADVLIEEQEKRDEEIIRKMKESGAVLDVPDPIDPSFVEIAVGQGSSEAVQHDTDCLMLLENVECEVDPALLIAAREEEDSIMEQVELDDDDDDDDVPEIVEKKKQDPISLLTSSDEDDVILQEPKIDTVEVSSADTSEDDMPLVKLVKPPSKQTSKEQHTLTAKRAKSLINQLLWGRNDFYCVHCRFATSDSAEYTKHMSAHNSKIIQICHDCGYTTSSKYQIQKHKQKHKNEKRFKCTLCNYSAKHKMSLVYHMKTHDSSVKEVEVAICGTYEPKSKMSRMSEKSGMSEKSRLSKKSKSAEKRYHCDTCDYKTDRRSDLKRHRRRIHSDADDDDEYVP